MKKQKLIIIAVQILIIVIICLGYRKPLETHSLDIKGESGISLKSGVYYVEIEYYAEVDRTNSVVITIGENEKANIRTNDFLLDNYTEMKSTPVWVLDDVTTLSVVPHASGDGAFEVHDLRIRETHQMRTMVLCGLLCLFGVFDILVWLDLYYGGLGRRKDYRKTVFALGLTIAFSCLPVMADYIIAGADLGFHLNRIESLKEGLLSGQIPTRIGSYWLRGKGYASSIYYADTFLLLPAVMRILGFSIQTAYLTYIAFINIITVLIAFFAFRKMFGRYEYGILAAVMYGMAPYRLYNIYARAAVGEYTAMAFLPLIILGFYTIYSLKAGEKKNSGWIYLTIGMSGIIQSHVLTCEMVAIFAAIFCVVMIRKTFKPGVFAGLVKAVCATVAVNLWFLVPFLDYMIREDVWVKHISENTYIQDRGLYLAHYLITPLFSGRTSNYNWYGMVGGEATTIGPAFLLCILLFIYMKCRKEIVITEKQHLVVGNVCFGLAMLGIYMSLNIFPWDALQRRSAILATLITSLQFPFRLLSLISALLVVDVCVLILGTLEERKKKIFAIALLGVQVMSSMFMMDEFLYERKYFELYTAENMGTISVANGEYIPTGAVLSDLFVNTQVAASESVVIKAYEKEYLDIAMEVESSTAGYVDVPLLYYSDYKAYDVATGEQLSVLPGEGMLVRVEIPEGFAGAVQVTYDVPALWRIAEAVSLVSVAGGICYLFMRRKQLWRK